MRKGAIVEQGEQMPEKDEFVEEVAEGADAGVEAPLDELPASGTRRHLSCVTKLQTKMKMQSFFIHRILSLSLMKIAFMKT